MGTELLLKSERQSGVNSHKSAVELLCKCVLKNFASPLVRG